MRDAFENQILARAAVAFRELGHLALWTKCREISEKDVSLEDAAELQATLNLYENRRSVPKRIRKLGRYLYGYLVGEHPRSYKRLWNSVARLEDLAGIERYGGKHEGE